eukprot:6197653-Pleurochrysis_carterae.AAC.1
MIKIREFDHHLCTFYVLVYLAIYFCAFSCIKHVANIPNLKLSVPRTFRHHESQHCASNSLNFPLQSGLCDSKTAQHASSVQPTYTSITLHPYSSPHTYHLPGFLTNAVETILHQVERARDQTGREGERARVWEGAGARGREGESVNAGVSVSVGVNDGETQKGGGERGREGARERERETDRQREKERESRRAREGVCVCVKERKTAKERECVCVKERAREKERDRERESESERERVRERGG